MDNIGGYKTVRELYGTPMVSVWTARRAGAGDGEVALKVFRPDPMIVAEAELEPRLGRFMQRAHLQRDAAAAGEWGRYWAPIHAADRIPGGAFYATDVYPSSAERLIASRVGVTEAGLLAITTAVASAIRGLLSSGGRGHGNIKPSNLLFSHKGAPERGRVVLSDPAADLGRAGAAAAASDLTALGQILYELVLHRPARGPLAAHDRSDTEWDRLGGRGRMWRELCQHLLDPAAALTVHDLADAVDDLKAGRWRAGVPGQSRAAGAAIDAMRGNTPAGARDAQVGRPFDAAPAGAGAHVRDRAAAGPSGERGVDRRGPAHGAPVAPTQSPLVAYGAGDWEPTPSPAAAAPAVAPGRASAPANVGTAGSPFAKEPFAGVRPLTGGNPFADGQDPVPGRHAERPAAKAPGERIAEQTRERDPLAPDDDDPFANAQSLGAGAAPFAAQRAGVHPPPASNGQPVKAPPTGQRLPARDHATPVAGRLAVSPEKTGAATPEPVARGSERRGQPGVPAATNQPMVARAPVPVVVPGRSALAGSSPAVRSKGEPATPTANGAGATKPPTKAAPAMADGTTVAAATAAPPPKTSEAEALAARAEARLQAGAWEAADADFTAAIGRGLRTATVYAGRAHARMGKGDRSAAAADFGEAIRVGPADPAHYNGRGYAHYLGGNYDRAMADFDAALRLDPRNAAAMSNRGCIRRRKGDLSGAVEDFSAASRLDPADPTPLLNRSAACLQLGELAKAVSDCAAALRKSNATAEPGRRVMIVDRTPLDAAAAADAAATARDGHAGSGLDEDAVDPELSAAAASARRRGPPLRTRVPVLLLMGVAGAATGLAAWRILPSAYDGAAGNLVLAGNPAAHVTGFAAAAMSLVAVVALAFGLAAPRFACWCLGLAAGYAAWVVAHLALPLVASMPSAIQDMAAALTERNRGTVVTGWADLDGFLQPPLLTYSLAGGLLLGIVASIVWRRLTGKIVPFLGLILGGALGYATAVQVLSKTGAVTAAGSQLLAITTSMMLFFTFLLVMIFCGDRRPAPPRRG